jgi:hypothetical protein
VTLKGRADVGLLRNVAHVDTVELGKGRHRTKSRTRAAPGAGTSDRISLSENCQVRVIHVVNDSRLDL